MASYYIDLPAAEFPRNALLDFSPIRQAMMDNRALEQQQYERQRQREEMKYQRGRNALSDKMAATKFAWETEDRNRPKLTEFDGNVGLYHPDTQSLSMLYKKEDDFAKYFGDPNSTPSNALTPRPEPSYKPDVETQNNYGSPAIGMRPSFNPMTGTSQSRPMNGMVVDEPNTPSVMQTSAPAVQDQPQDQMVRIGNKMYTRDQAMDLTAHPNPAIRNRAQNAIKELDGKFDTSSISGRQNVAAKYGLTPDDPRYQRYVMLGKLDDEKKSFNENQTKMADYASRMIDAEKVIGGLSSKGFDPTSKQESAMSKMPVVGNMMISKERQQYEQAAREFIAAILRRDTGAAVRDEEFNQYFGTYFPQIGDAPEVVEQKARSRQRLADGLRRGSGGAYDEMFPDNASNQQTLDYETRYGLEK